MIRENFYTGEPIPPPNLISETEAVQNASFGRNFAEIHYGLGGNAYQPQQQNPGYNPYFQTQQMGYNPYINYSQSNPYMANPYNYSQQSFNYGSPYGNPVFAYMNRNGMFPQFQQPTQQQQVYIKPVTISGDYLPPAGIENEINEMMRKVIDEQMETDAKNIAARSKAYRDNNFNPFYTSNYYQLPVFAQQYSSYNREVYSRIEQIKQEAKQARTDFSINLSKIAHHYLNDGVDDDQIEDMYTGKYINVNDNSDFSGIYRQMCFQQRAQNLVPVDPAAKYRYQIAAVQNEIRKYIPEDADLEKTSEGMNELFTKWKLEEEKDRRRDVSIEYNNSAYKTLVLRKKAERIANEQGFSLDPNAPLQTIKQINSSNKNIGIQNRDEIKKQIAESTLRNMFPDLANSGSYIDNNGMLVAKCNPPTSSDPVIVNSQEQEYENDKHRFEAFLNSMPKINEMPEKMVQQQKDEYNTYIDELLAISDKIT